MRIDGEIPSIPVPGTTLGDVDFRKLDLAPGFLRAIRRPISLGSKGGACPLLLFPLPLPEPRLPEPAGVLFPWAAEPPYERPSLLVIRDA